MVEEEVLAVFVGDDCPMAHLIVLQHSLDGLLGHRPKVGLDRRRVLELRVEAIRHEDSEIRRTVSCTASRAR